MSANQFSQTISFEPPLPCGVIFGYRICGKPATVAQTDFINGTYTFLPICKGCTVAAMALYEPLDEVDSGSTRKDKENHER